MWSAIVHIHGIYTGCDVSYSTPTLPNLITSSCLAVLRQLHIARPLLSIEAFKSLVAAQVFTRLHGLLQCCSGWGTQASTTPASVSSQRGCPPLHVYGRANKHAWWRHFPPAGTPLAASSAARISFKLAMLVFTAVYMEPPLVSEIYIVCPVFYTISQSIGFIRDRRPPLWMTT
jgi:hypothetical protein